MPARLFFKNNWAHGVTGTIKNALDWLVSFIPFAYKPVAIINASPRAVHADAALREILKTMAATIVESASVTIALHGKNLTEDEMVAAPVIADAIQSALRNLHATVCA